MDPIATVVGVTAVIGSVVAIATFVYSRRQNQEVARRAVAEATRRAHLEAPLVTAEDVSVLWDGSADPGAIARGVNAVLKNQGASVARAVVLEARLFLVKEERFTVPSDDEAPAQFTGHVGAIAPGESTGVTALPSAKALQAGAIPLFDPDAIPVIKTTVKFTDALGNPYVEPSVMAGTPQGYEAGAYDHTPQAES